MRRIVTALFLAASAHSALAQQDTIRYKDPKRAKVDDCEITSITVKQIAYNRYVNDSAIPQKDNAADVADFTIDSSRKPFDFSAGENAMNEGKYAEAITRFRKAIADPQAPDPVKQMAYRHIAFSYFNSNDIDSALAAIQALRKAFPETYYLRESWELQYKCYLGKEDTRKMEETLKGFADNGTSLGLADWTKSVELMRAGLLEMQGKWNDALPLHVRYVNDSSEEIRTNARLGEMRCLAAQKNWGSLQGKADAIIREAKDKKNVNERLLTGAYNGRGECMLAKNSLKEALLDFLRGVVELNRSGVQTQEHEMAIYKSGLCSARIATASTDKDVKDEYRKRAGGLYAELEAKYRGSPLIKKLLEEINAIK